MPSEEKKNSKWIYIRWVLLRVCLAVFDILAVNASIIIALYTRFYVAYEYHSTAGKYFRAYFDYAPYYTVFCLVLFLCFKLYSSLWRYAGLHDLNRILSANLLCIAGHIAGTVLFFRRMPISVYAISGVIQLCLITASRFTYRFLMLEKEKTGTAGKINTAVIGTGATAQTALSQIARDKHLNAVCAVDYLDSGFNGTMDGLPLLSGIGGLQNAIEKYDIKVVILASASMPQSIRRELKKICEENDIDCYDYYWLRQSIGNTLTQSTLEEHAKGPVNILLDGKTTLYENIRKAFDEIEGEYTVKSLSAGDSVLNIELQSRDKKALNDLSEDWVKEQEEKTGEEISFF